VIHEDAKCAQPEKGRFLQPTHATKVTQEVKPGKCRKHWSADFDIANIKQLRGGSQAELCLKDQRGNQTRQWLLQQVRTIAIKWSAKERALFMRRLCWCA